MLIIVFVELVLATLVAERRVLTEDQMPRAHQEFSRRVSSINEFWGTSLGKVVFSLERKDGGSYGACR
jgi:hypothetical protein